jgi:3-deoxy-D-manno-octulosonate 8-phosphate phosphatase KdsC-like HAD superfamily phosphatase
VISLSKKKKKTSLLITHNEVICKVSQIRDGIGMKLSLSGSKEVEIIRQALNCLINLHWPP